MYRKLDDFLAAFNHVQESTQQVMDLLDDKNVDVTVAPGHRTIGQIGWHIVTTIIEMMNRTGLALASVDHEAPPPENSLNISRMYKNASSELLKTIETKWDDDTLEQTDNMYGEDWQRGKTLTALVHHEIHHRAEMIILLRQAGNKVPGVFGPSKEEWTSYNMEPPPY